MRELQKEIDIHRMIALSILVVPWFLFFKLTRRYYNDMIYFLIGPRQANLVLIAYASSEGSGEPAHPRSLARTFATRSYKQ